MYIYALLEPSTGAVRYIGASSDPERRLWEHRCHCKRGRTYRDNWLRALIATGEQPILAILERVDTADWQSRERFWISKMREIGEPLVNLTEGGEGLSNPSEQTRDKLRRARLGHVHTEEAKEKMRLAALGNQRWQGRKHSEETKQKIGQASRGRKWSPEARMRYANRNGDGIRARNLERARLSDTQVREIRALQGKLTYAEIARLYGISKRMVGCVVNRESYKHVD